MNSRAALQPTQDNRPIAISTPLGKDELLLRSLRYREELGVPFSMEVEMQSTEWNIDFDQIVGQPVSIRILMTSTKQNRYINGFMVQFMQVATDHGLASYRGLIVPWIWFLGRSSKCRVYLDKSVPEIVQSIFSDYGFTDIQNNLGKPSTDYAKIPLCIQYDETDLNFVNRLLESEGIYYYFNNTPPTQNAPGTQTIVLCDAASKPPTMSGYTTVYYNPLPPSQNRVEHIFEWVGEMEVQSGSYTLDDYDYRNPSTVLQETVSVASAYDHGSYGRYDFPGGYNTTEIGRDLATIRLQEQQSLQAIQRGASNLLGLASGYQFQISGLKRTDQNGAYMVTNLEMEVKTSDFLTTTPDNSEYSCLTRFRTIATQTNFSPRRRALKPRMQGLQTATVLGTAGNPGDTDQYGNVRVQFHWGDSSANSTCLVRLSQTSAGNGWGAMFLPNTGDEVVVSFENGDPDRPLVIGRVYNGQALPMANPSQTPKLSYLFDSSKKNIFQMDATTSKEKLLIQNGANSITMDSTAGAEGILITDGKSSITFDTPNGNVDTKNANDENKWTLGDWSEWVKGVKVSQVVGLAWNLYFGAYTKICVGLDFGAFLGARVEMVTGGILKSLAGWELKSSNSGKGLKSPNMLSQCYQAFSQHFTKVVKSNDEAKQIVGIYALSAGSMEQEVTGSLTVLAGISSETVEGAKRSSSDGPMLLMSESTITVEATDNVDLVSGFNVTINGAVIEIG